MGIKKTKEHTNVMKKNITGIKKLSYFGKLHLVFVAILLLVIISVQSI